MMKIAPMKGFGSKLMVASKAVNTIPENYLSYSRNARIFDGGIWPRRGKSLLYSSSSTSNNKGGFSLNSKLYQIAEGKIFVLNADGTRTEKATLGYDQRVDVMAYQAQKGTYSSLATAETHSYDLPVYHDGIGKAWEIWYEVDGGTARLALRALDSGTRTTWGYINLTSNNGTYSYPVIKLWYVGTTSSSNFGTGRDESWTYYLLEPGQYMSLSTGQYVGDIKLDVGYYVAKSKILIAAPNQSLRLYDGESTVTEVTATAPTDNSGILEFCRSYSFLASGNVLHISRPITAANPEYAYDFTGAGSQTITYETEIVALKSTMNGLYVFTKNKVEFLGANSLQNVAGSATFISTPIGEGMEAISNLAVVAAGDKIFTITKNLQVQTVNYVSGVTSAQIGELSARPVIGIREFMNTVDPEQPSAFGFYNETDKTVQFHIRSLGSPFNDYVLVYDLVNDTWNVDTAKNYCYVVKHGADYYGYSDVNSSVYLDDVGYSDAGVAIEFRIRTQNLNQWTPFQKRYGGFYLTGGIGALTEIGVTVNVDGDNAFQDSVSGNAFGIPELGEIGTEIGGSETGGWLTYSPKLYPFDRMADEGRMFTSWKRVQYEIFSYSQIQDFILDGIWTRFEVTGFMDVSEKF